MYFSSEKRPLKRTRLGPPDVYPQDPRQKEDELTQSNVKHGFSTSPQLSDEFGSARNYNISASKVGAYFGSIQNKKEELNTFPDTGRKRQQINTKDNFWPATARTKNAIENWFKDLAGNKSLSQLSKKAPNFNKKEEIFVLLCEHNVPLMRAAWFLKLSSAYTVAVSEAKMKKRQLPDPTEEWTVTLTRFLKDQLSKIQDFYQNPQQDLPMTEDQKQALKQWRYCLRLAKYSYEENLIDRQEILKWILEQLDRLKSPSIEDNVLRLVVPLAQQYLDEFVHSELFSRRLAYLCARKLSLLATSAKSSTSSKPSTALIPSSGDRANPATNVFSDLLQCQHHRSIVISLSSIIQVISLECPTALVWNCIGEGKSPSPLNGSPLDQLPVSPSELPMPELDSNAFFRQELKMAEDGVKSRSRAAESRWSCDKWQQSSDAQTTGRVLNALDALDRHCFDRTDSNNNLDTLYASIFPKDTPANDTVASDECIIEILCEWAVSSVRYGEHRAMAVAKLLEKRQAYLTGDTAEGDDKESVSSLTGVQNAMPIYQLLLMKYLDNDAPVLDENGSMNNKTMFTNLVHLFGELIRNDVFSHDIYMCTLISRGDLYNSSGGYGGGKSESPGDGRGGNDDDTSLFPGIDLKPTKMDVQGHDYDDSKIDDDLDKLLQHIKEEQQNSMDQADSPKDVSMTHVVFGKQPSRHLLYTTHLPLPQDEGSSHDCNQRHVLLYGVGKLRDEARHTVKKCSKEISKLFNKKFSIDAADGKVKKYSRNEFNFESVTSRFQSLSYFDQHVVTHQCSLVVIEMLINFSNGSTNYLPVPEHIAFLFDLMELSLNIHRLIELCIQMVKELPAVESQMCQKGWSTDRSYTNTVSLYVVGVLRHYHACLLLCRDQSVAVFEGLCNVVKHVTNPADCSSAERCILVHLYDLYSSCSLLKSKPHCVEPFQNAYPKIKQALYCSIQPNPSSQVFNSSFMPDLFVNPKRNGKIEASWVRQLNESASNRYSLVCNAIIAVANEPNNDKLNNIALTCAELTACCNALSAEWLGALQALCASSSLSCYFMDLLQRIDLQDVGIHNALAVFVSILIARHCFGLVDFISVIIPSLVARGPDLDGECGARLACHLLLRLFKTVECPQPGLYSEGTSPHPSEGFCMKLSCDRHLLTATHNTADVGPVLLVLKAILVVADISNKHSKPMKKETKVTTPLGAAELSISHILGTSDILGAGHDLMSLSAGRSNPCDSSASLADFAQHVLKQITCQEWVLERCLQNPEELCTPDMLLDSMLTPKQAQRLLHMICYHSSGSDSIMDQKLMISRILDNLDLWTLRISWLDLQLMFKQFTPGSSDLNQWLDTVANAAIDVFQLGISGDSSKDDKALVRKGSGNIWLVAPLVSKLPSAVRGRVLSVAGNKLQSQNWCGKSRDREKSGSRQSSLLSHQPFLSLVLTCLKGQDEQREDLLTSLHKQLSQYLTLSKDERLGLLEDSKGRAMIQDALQLRFSLVGGMFDTVQRSTSTTTEWALLLLQLITQGVIDLNNNADLFTTVIDMLATLIHSTLITDSSSERSDDNKKHYMALMKKLKKEVGDRSSRSMTTVRQLLPFVKLQEEIIACQPAGTLTDNRGNKIAFDSIDKKQGLQISEKQKVAPWEILEGHKNPAPLSWSWFGAVRVERKQLWYEDTHRLLKFHTHNLTKPTSYYLEPPPLPPEDLDPVPEKPCSCVYCNAMKDDKADTPSSDTSPRGKKGPKKSIKRRKTDAVVPQPVMPQPMQQQQQQQQQQLQQQQQQQQQQMPMQNMYQNQGGMYGPCQGQGPNQQMAPQQQWGYQQQPSQQMMPQQQQQQQQNYFPPQMNQQNRFERPNNQQSKAALTNMLRMRMPPAQQFMGGQFPQQPMQQPIQQRQPFIRQQMRPQVNMQNPMMNMYQGMQQQGGMNQNYGGYGGQQQMMNQPNAMFGNFGQGGGGGGGGAGGGAGMMTMQRPNDYAPPGPCMTPQRPMTQQRPYIQQTPNVTMNTMGGGMQGPAPPYPRAPGPPVQSQMGQSQNQQFQVNQQRMRMMAMHQQQGNNPNQQPTLMSQLQRQNQMGYQHQPPPY